MWVVILLICVVAYIATITRVSYHLGCTKTDNARVAAIVGFFLSFLPPIALIYLIILMLKEDASTV